MSVRWWFVTVVFSVVAAALGVSLIGAAPIAAQGRPTYDLTWWAIGDSYSSGEGISNVEPECARASGVGIDAKAWAVVAREILDEERFKHWAFTPCTGDDSTKLSRQLSEASDESGQEMADLVTLSMGGNDILFPDVVRGCIDAPNSWRNLKKIGCEVTRQEMRNRIDMLAGSREMENGQYSGITLPEMYRDIAERVHPGGEVVVLGYPLILEKVSEWDTWRRNLIGGCEGVQASDIDMLRATGAYLNDTIADAVDSANERWRSKGVSFSYLDVQNEVYETAEGRHNLCSQEPWLNGLTIGTTSGESWKFSRSFHPNQIGHTQTGNYVGWWMGSGGLSVSDMRADGTPADDVRCRNAQRSGNRQFVANLAVDALNRGAYEMLRDCATTPEAIDLLRAYEWARPFKLPVGRCIEDRFGDFECLARSHNGLGVRIVITPSSRFFGVANGAAEPVRAPTWDEVAGAAIPSICGDQPPTTLVQGRSTAITDRRNGAFELLETLENGQPGVVEGIPSNDAGLLTAVVASCDLGGVAWPNVIVFFSSGPEFYASTFLEDIDSDAAQWIVPGPYEPAREGINTVSLAGEQLEVYLDLTGPGDAACCSSYGALAYLNAHDRQVHVVNVVEDLGD